MILQLIKKLLIFIIIINIMPSCSSDNKKIFIEQKKTFSLEKVYKEAYKNFEEGKYEDSIKLFELVEKDYSYTPWASKSLLMRSYIYYDSGQYIKALAHLQKYKKRYAGSKNIDYVEYLIGMCLFEQINFATLSQENTHLAFRQFSKIIDQFPNSEYAYDAKFKIDLINDQLAAKEMYLARFYIKKQKWTPAIIRLNNVIEKYETTIFIEEALHRLVEIYYNLGNIKAAKKYASILGYNYNESDWYKRSYNIVENTNIPLSKVKQKKTFKDSIKKILRMN